MPSPPLQWLLQGRLPGQGEGPAIYTYTNVKANAARTQKVFQQAAEPVRGSTRQEPRGRAYAQGALSREAGLKKKPGAHRSAREPSAVGGHHGATTTLLKFRSPDTEVRKGKR